MRVEMGADRDGDRGRLAPRGAFDLAHAPAIARALEDVGPRLDACRSVDVDLTQLDRIDGAGAVLLARLLDRLEADGRQASVVEGDNPEAARLIALYRERRAVLPAPQTRATNPLTRIGALVAHLPGKANDAFDFIGRC